MEIIRVSLIAKVEAQITITEISSQDIIKQHTSKEMIYYPTQNK